MTGTDHNHDALVAALRQPALPAEQVGEEAAVAAMIEAQTRIPAASTRARSRRGVAIAAVTVASLGLGGLAAAGPGIFSPAADRPDTPATTPSTPATSVDEGEPDDDVAPTTTADDAVRDIGNDTAACAADGAGAAEPDVERDVAQDCGSTVEPDDDAVGTAHDDADADPVDGDDPPGDGDDAPGRTGDTPGRSGRSPGRSGTTPGRSGATPDQIGDTPGQIGDTPGQTGDTPGQTGDTPGQTGNTPGQTGNTPGQTGNTPGQTGNTPRQTGETPGRSAGQPGPNREP